MNCECGGKFKYSHYRSCIDRENNIYKCNKCGALLYESRG